MTWIKVTFRQEGWHRWLEAPSTREYLRAPHRHVFHVTCKMTVSHFDREVELHDMLQICKMWFSDYVCANHSDVEHPSMDWSCEMFAAGIVDNMSMQWPSRRYECEVSEDGECGAVVSGV